jgi:translocation and assembly module TamB
VAARIGADGPLTVEARAAVLGQPGELSATLPWSSLLSAAKGKLDWGQWTAHLRLPDWDMVALAPLTKGLLRPRGQLDADVTLSPGRQWAGHLRLSGLATRPIAPVGVLRGISADLRLGSDGLRLEQARAELGGHPIVARGFWHWGEQEPPGFRLTLAGTNLAFIRQADLFLRGDVALELSGTNLTAGRITGNITLRDSLLLRDLRSLVSGSIEQPETRPPFFSVPQPPFGDWQLDVRVAGDRFLRVITPVFKGRVSAALQLTGALREPMSLGDVTVPEGQVLFPFGALQVEQGRGTLSRSAPFRPELAFHATGQNFGYEVRLDVSGPADNPALFFSSVPPLTSTQILLMLTSGDIPSGTFNYSSRGRLQNIGLFLGREFLGKLTGSVGESRLSMRTGEQVSDRGQLTYTIEYQLSPRWSAFGIKDRFDNYGGGFKWRVFSK